MIASRISRSICHVPQKVIPVIVLVGLIANANASEVLLVPDSPIDDLGVGDLINVDVLIDFSDIPGGTLGGGFDIQYDDTALALTILTSAGLGEAVMGREPDATSGLLEGWAVGDFQGLAGTGQVSVGTVQFRVKSTAGNDIQISASSTDSIGGPWISGDDFVSELVPTYNQVTITFDPDHLHGSGFESP